MIFNPLGNVSFCKCSSRYNLNLDKSSKSELLGFIAALLAPCPQSKISVDPLRYNDNVGVYEMISSVNKTHPPHIYLPWDKHYYSALAYYSLISLCWEGLFIYYYHLTMSMTSSF